MRTPSGLVTYTWTARNELHQVFRGAQLWSTYAYDDVGNRRSVAYANGTVQALAYNAKNQLTEIQNTAGQAVISSYGYTVDPRGLRTSVVEHTGRRVDYRYDALRRLVEEAVTEAGVATATTYTLDAVGNRLAKRTAKPGGLIETTGYAYNANDELLTENGSDGLVSYGYNANGETTSKSSSAGGALYHWDADGRMVGFQSAGTTASFTYDVDGIRLAKSANGQATRFLVDKNRDYAQVLEERSGSGEIDVAYIYGDDLISQERSGAASFYHTDGQLSTRQLTNASGQVTDRYTYDAFGVTLASTGTTANNYLYTGEQFDPNVGFYHL